VQNWYPGDSEGRDGIFIRQKLKRHYVLSFFEKRVHPAEQFIQKVIRPVKDNEVVTVLESNQEVVPVV
jgi:hypothetical protein